MLTVSHVTRTFGSIRALDDASFEVPRGQLTGFVGGNGAGKTTAMRILMQVLAADAGSVTLDGAPVTRDAARRFGYMPEERGLYPKMAAAAQVAYLGTLHGLDRKTAEGRAIQLLSELGLGERAYDHVEKLSLGNQQRAQIAAALVHDPDVLILDEPFSGLDPLAVESVMNILAGFARRGAAVLFSSHQLDVIERITDSLVIIAGGRIRAVGTPLELVAAYATPRFALAAADIGWVSAWPGVREVFVGMDEVSFEADDDAAQQVLRRALDLGPVGRFGPVVPRLAEVFKDVVQDIDPLSTARREGVTA
ncbi:MAG: ATP-binding cassette domain-containing protein [Bifidobacteriaceae bacterium]|jgi:ABC-2 type transport system ATP-binding protein|nr:ATP-binding cassette domain-containing protein [Bifidobacteriaceae bacterium]